jgi:hypothetical protein
MDQKLVPSAALWMVQAGQGGKRVHARARERERERERKRKRKKRGEGEREVDLRVWVEFCPFAQGLHGSGRSERKKIRTMTFAQPSDPDDVAQEHMASLNYRQDGNRRYAWNGPGFLFGAFVPFAPPRLSLTQAVGTLESHKVWIADGWVPTLGFSHAFVNRLELFFGRVNGGSMDGLDRLEIGVQHTALPVKIG